MGRTGELKGHSWGLFPGLLPPGFGVSVVLLAFESRSSGALFRPLSALPALSVPQPRLGYWVWTLERMVGRRSIWMSGEWGKESGDWRRGFEKQEGSRG